MKKHWFIDEAQHKWAIVAKSTSWKAMLYLIIGLILIATLYFQFNTETLLWSLETELDKKQTWYWIAFIGLCLTGYAWLLLYKWEDYIDVKYGEKLWTSDFWFESEYKEDVLAAIANGDQSIIDLPRYKYIDERGQEIIIYVQNTLKNNSDIVFIKVMQGNKILSDWQLIPKNNKNQWFINAIKSMVETLDSD